MKHQIPEAKVKELLRHIQTMQVLTVCMEIEFHQELIDKRWKDPHTSNHIRKLKESLEQIKKGLSFKFKVKDHELMNFEHPVQVHRLFKYFSTMETNQLSLIMDQYEEYDRVNPPEIVMI